MKHFRHLIFCSPNDYYEYDDNLKFVNRLTEENFILLEKAHINAIYGWAYDQREETIIKLLNLCEKHHIDFYLALQTTNEYLSLSFLKGKYKGYDELNQTEKDDLDRRFIEEIERYTSYPALKGIIFEDEAGYLCFPAVLHAKEVFEKHFPNLEFHTNFLGYTINEQWFWCPVTPSGVSVPEDIKPFKLEGDLEIKFENRFTYYPKFLNGLLEKSHFDFISFDKYPFECEWEEAPHFIHLAFVDGVAIFSELREKYNAEALAYLQVGMWFRETSLLLDSEFSFMMHLIAMYGLTGFGYFPGFYPLDFVINPNGLFNKDNGEAGLFDINGKPTRFYNLTLSMNEYFASIEDDILNSEFIGIKSYGTYYNNFDMEIAKKHADGEVIFDGTLPNIKLMDNQDIDVKSNNNLLVSLFKKDNKNRYYLLNTSTLCDNEIEITLPNGKYIVKGVNYQKEISNIYKTTLKPGEGLYIINQ